MDFKKQSVQFRFQKRDKNKKTIKIETSNDSSCFYCQKHQFFMEFFFKFILSDYIEKEKL